MRGPASTLSSTTLRVLIASSEVHPYSKTGGLADMTGALGRALARAGHQVGMVKPLFRGLRERVPQLRRQDWRFDLPLGNRRVDAELWVHEPEPRLTVYFIGHDPYFDRAGLYNENGRDYPDNAERFIFFSKCVVHLGRYLPWRPELIHVHDWQTALVPLLVRHQRRHEGWTEAPRTCLTVHNLAYQGYFPAWAYELTNLPWDYFHPDCAEAYGQLNCLKAGIATSDRLTTVSPRYAREILTEEFGEGLAWLLRRRQSHLRGILNGVDYDEWNTEHNPHLPASYSWQDLRGKALVKQALLQEMGLPGSPEMPLFGTITRLAEQKGLDILLPALHEMLAASMRFVLLGSGEARYADALQRLQKLYPQKVAVRIGFDAGLAHRIEAGCDFYLMPSRFEPCGLNQMYSLRYGTVPIVRAVGGLDDTVVDARESLSRANGIKFHEYSAAALAHAIRKAMVLYRHPDLLRQYQINGMKVDFSWDRTATEYTQVYREALAAPLLD
ncbi:MAG: glycogen synthase GlgA [Verrucomicrobiota bacterium]|nr:glycogen synthase GlgA [Limisphaera sp.]MDW8382291.1 glycogen synthase GlgA [Verrucomicrobiota bacterium]